MKCFGPVFSVSALGSLQMLSGRCELRNGVFFGCKKNITQKKQRIMKKRILTINAKILIGRLPIFYKGKKDNTFILKRHHTCFLQLWHLYHLWYHIYELLHSTDKIHAFVIRTGTDRAKKAHMGKLYSETLPFIFFSIQSSSVQNILGGLVHTYNQMKWVWVWVSVVIIQRCFIASEKYITQRKGRRRRKSYLPIIYQFLSHSKHSTKERSMSNSILTQRPLGPLYPCHHYFLRYHLHALLLPST